MNVNKNIMTFNIVLGSIKNSVFKSEQGWAPENEKWQIKKWTHFQAVEKPISRWFLAFLAKWWTPSVGALSFLFTSMTASPGQTSKHVKVRSRAPYNQNS